MRKKAICRCCLAMILILFGSHLMWAQEADIDLNFVDKDLELFIEFVAKVTKKKILYGPSLKSRKIYLVAPTHVTKKQLFKIFLSVMEYNDFILERTGVPGTSSELIKVKRKIQGAMDNKLVQFLQKMNLILLKTKMNSSLW